MFRQAIWEEPLVFELSRKGARGYVFPKLEEDIRQELDYVLPRIPKDMMRKDLNLPEMTEPEVIRHYIRLSQENYGITSGMYPLGSCTMKYNPVVNDRLACLKTVRNVHPLQDISTIQGSLEVLYRLEKALCELTGMSKFTFCTGAGSHGEFLGCLIIKAYHESKGREKKNIVVPDSAHGSNPASASMAGFNVSIVRTGKDGCIDLNDLENVVDENTAGLMLTNPNTLGIFEKEIEEIVKIVKKVDGLLYYDGANLNAIVGKVRPGDMGFDMVHLNLHKTFSTPHGGGGPGAGPLGVTSKLADFLPSPTVEFDGNKYYLDYQRPKAVKKVKMFYGNFSVYVRAYAYLLRMGHVGLKKVAETSVLASNYMLSKVSKIRGIKVPYDPKRPRKHEFVISLQPLYKDTGISAKDFAKRLIDYGLHPPTIYFPLIVEEAFMIEPTETESKREVDRYCEVMAKISDESYDNPEVVKSAPHNSSVRRVDEAYASHPRTITLSWRMSIKRPS